MCLDAPAPATRGVPLVVSAGVRRRIRVVCGGVEERYHWCVMDAAWWWNAIWSVIPTVVIGAMFGLIIYAALNADRKVRQERKSVEVEERERFEAERARRTES